MVTSSSTLLRASSTTMFATMNVPARNSASAIVTMDQMVSALFLFSPMMASDMASGMCRCGFLPAVALLPAWFPFMPLFGCAGLTSAFLLAFLFNAATSYASSPLMIVVPS